MPNDRPLSGIAFRGTATCKEHLQVYLHERYNISEPDCQAAFENHCDLLESLSECPVPNPIAKVAKAIAKAIEVESSPELWSATTIQQKRKQQ